MIFLSQEDLKAKGIRYHRTQLWRMEREGKFPKRVRISENRIGWIAAEIYGWMGDRAKVRHAAE